MERVNLTLDEERARQVFEAMSRLRGLTDAEIAKYAGITRQAVAARRVGRTRIALGDLAWLTEALGVDRDVFFMDPREAIRQVLDTDGLRDRETIWYTTAAKAA